MTDDLNPLSRTMALVLKTRGIDQPMLASVDILLDAPFGTIGCVIDGQAKPTESLVAAFSRIFDVDLYPLAICLFPTHSKYPDSLAHVVRKLAAGWEKTHQKDVDRLREAIGP
jgi:hypothetical protein